jgi:amino acid transporter
MSERRRIRFWDLVLYATAINFGIRWLATAAAAGPPSLPIWLLAALGFLAPLTIATAELAGRFEGEGAIYAWTRAAFGPFAGFMCGWIYWMSNLPFFSGLLFFIIEVVARIAPPEWQGALQAPEARLAIAVALSAAILVLNLMGLGAAKWLPAAGAVASLGLLALLLVIGFASGLQHGPATDFVHVSYLPPLDANGAILWGTMVFGYAGAEGVALLRNEIEGGTGKLVRAIALIGAFLAVAYIAGTIAMLSILTPEQASRLAGLPEALQVGLARAGLGAAIPYALALLIAASLGGYSAWFAAAARIPYAAGLDQALPKAFGAADAKTGAPVASMMVQAALVVVLLVISQAGASIAAAYDFIIAMSVLSYTLPFLFLFAAYLKAQRTPAAPGVWTAPGGRSGAVAIGILGFAITASAVACTLVPSPAAADQMGALIKLLIATAVMLGSGAALYLLAAMRKSAPAQ